MGEFDLKSSTLDKGLEIAKDFVDKLIMPTVEETGLFLKDHLTMWRFSNQLKMLNKAKNLCEKHNIKTKKISLKVLVPLLEYATLEEDDSMQEKWAILLTNLIDSQQNIENHVFPYILSQLSSNEFYPMEKVYENCLVRRFETQKELKDFKTFKPSFEENMKKEIAEIDQKLNKAKQPLKYGSKLYELRTKKRHLERDLTELSYREISLKHAILRPEIVKEEDFQSFEISNLVRLGLVKEVREFFAESQTLEIPLGDEDFSEFTTYANVDLDIEMDSTTEYILTDLGELFFKACREKKTE
ncbi:Abi-alpha family protein [Chryseobacterium indoltheticum]|uniref:DUF4393 domain-containing protein n=1 Tax=Chryseobacterium indoltheticum TaxID=254 RepID=A0A3G6N3V2_9FLAO|nr:Abi-alpha family protein [Chryseobacterium indoltheticum]AZA60206.1 DUF4393 domain-containing protein [Chryseobacterium indoltheticum]